MVERASTRQGKMVALYQDTRGSMALVMDAAGQLLGRSYVMLTHHVPQPGWVEYDPHEIWHRSWQAAEHAIKAAGTSWGELAAIGVTTQRGTVVLWERETGRPIGPAISWRDTRTAEICQELRAGGYEEIFWQRTGRGVDTAVAGAKIHWLLTHIPGLRRRAQQGEICAGTVDSWTLWNLTGGAVHATDLTNACATGLFNLHTLDWDAEILELLDIPREILPQPRPSGYPYGRLRDQEVPIRALCADQQAALFGQFCFDPGVVKVTYGRDAVVMVESGGGFLDTARQLHTVIAAGLDGEAVRFALEGQVLAAGKVVDWLRDELALIPTAADSELLAQQVPDSGGIYLIPAFQGLGAPYWQPEVRGMVVGLVSTSNRAQLVRAALEGVAYRVRDVIEAMSRWAGSTMIELRADGGAAVNNFLLQFQADLLGIPVLRHRVSGVAPVGVAFLAGLQAGVWASREEVTALQSEDRRFEPAIGERSRERLYQGWSKALRQALVAGVGRDSEERASVGDTEPF